MMNSSSSESASQAFAVPVTTFLYRDMHEPVGGMHDRDNRRADTEKAPLEKVTVARGPTPQEIAEMVSHGRADAVAETEQHLKSGYDAKIEAQRLRVHDALAAFAEERKNYFASVESEVVQLALAIAAKILHRESQVDPLLVAGLVRVAIEKLHDGSRVTVRVGPRDAQKWRQAMANPANGSTVEIVEDPQLQADDCVLETDLGSAQFSLDAQLKEVEQGFFDLLAHRPVIK